MPGTAAMDCVDVAQAGITHPFGDERGVTQAFPAGVPSKLSDPFLMCDFYRSVSEGEAPHEDHFPVDWHPHRGFDILSYLKTGVGRHGDSLGNRETFATPGMQWMSTGSGVEHAEGGGTPKGGVATGFQIWVNVPADRKMDDPRYGTEPPESIPQHEVAPGAQARVLAGAMGGHAGPFKTVTPVQMIDFELAAGASVAHEVTAGLDTCLVYVYEGSGQVSGDHPLTEGSVAVLDATKEDTRSVQLKSGESGLKALLFAGKRLNEPIAWHGPIVMNTQRQIHETFDALQRGEFPPKRVPWDYKKASAAPNRQG